MDISIYKLTRDVVAGGEAKRCNKIQEGDALYIVICIYI